MKSSVAQIHVMKDLYTSIIRAVVPASVAWVAIAGSSSSSPAQRVETVRPLAYTRFVLPNGLVALLNEDHGSPIVAVDVWYHIGAKDEPSGRTGFAHLCEHLMGEGSPNLMGTQKSVRHLAWRNVQPMGQHDRRHHALLLHAPARTAGTRAVDGVRSDGVTADTR
jgi:hypothetical protein